MWELCNKVNDHSYLQIPKTFFEIHVAEKPGETRSISSSSLCSPRILKCIQRLIIFVDCLIVEVWKAFDFMLKCGNMK